MNELKQIEHQETVLVKRLDQKNDDLAIYIPIGFIVLFLLIALLLGSKYVMKSLKKKEDKKLNSKHYKDYKEALKTLDKE